MKLYEILNEAIESSREQIKQTLENNKELLQKQRTRMGVTRILSQLFPGVNFKWLANPKDVGAAYYHPRTREITVGNIAGLMTGKTVRHKWEGFVDVLVDFLTHENIHKEQHRRRNYRFNKAEDASPEFRRSIKNKYADLIDRYEDASGQQKEELENKLQKFIRKSRAQGVGLPLFDKDYLSIKDEITAYAEMIANELVSTLKNSGYSNEVAKRGALIELRYRNKGYKGTLSKYRKIFTGHDKTLKRVLKQAVRFIEQM